MILAPLLLAVAPLAQLSPAQCPPRRDSTGEPVGDRAIVADDGRAAVVQCGDGVVWRWRAGETFVSVGPITLLAAARDAGIVPADLRCPWPSTYSDPRAGEADCEVLEHHGALWVLRSGIVDFVMLGASVLRESDLYECFGAVVDRDGVPALLFANTRARPNLLQRQPLTGGEPVTVASIGDPDLEGHYTVVEADQVASAPAAGLAIVSFGGIFRVAYDITYLRAFDANGTERWSLRLPAPRTEQVSIRDTARALVIDGGRHLLFARDSEPTATQVIDAQDGSLLGAMRGWPLGASSAAGVVVVRADTGEVNVVRLGTP